MREGLLRHRGPTAPKKYRILKFIVDYFEVDFSPLTLESILGPY